MRNDPKKWVEVNIHFSDPQENRRVLLAFVKPFVEDCKKHSLIESWHFFEERCPQRGPKLGEPEIRLRFYGESEDIDAVKDQLSSKLRNLVASSKDPITYYHFGNHGEPGDYVGEANYWGNDWSIAMKQYQEGAELGLWFIQNFSSTMPLERWQKISHLILNQLLVPHGNFHTTVGATLDFSDKGLYLFRVE